MKSIKFDLFQALLAKSSWVLSKGQQSKTERTQMDLKLEKEKKLSKRKKNQKTNHI